MILADKNSHHIYKNVFEVYVQSPCLKVYNLTNPLSNDRLHKQPTDSSHSAICIYTHEFQSLSHILNSTNWIRLHCHKIIKYMQSWNVLILLYIISKPHANFEGLYFLFALGAYNNSQRYEVSNHFYATFMMLIYRLVWIVVNLHISFIHLKAW